MVMPAEDLIVRIRWEDDLCVVHLVGALEVTSESLVREALDAMTTATTRIVIDLSEVSYVDVRGLDALTTSVAAVNGDGAAVELRGWPLPIERVADALPPAASWRDSPPPTH